MGFRGLLAVPALGSLLVVCLPALAAGQTGASPYKAPTGRVVALASGSIAGAVLDENGQAIAGAVVSAIGEITTFAVTDARGQFELGSLSPGQYLVRAHLAGFLSPRAQVLDVRPNLRIPSSIALRRASRTVLAAGVGLPSAGSDSESVPMPAPATASVAPAPVSSASGQASAADGEEHGETAWRIRHTRRGILKDVTITEVDNEEHPGGVGPNDLLERAVNAPARLAGSFFADTPFSGEVNLLTIGSFDSPQELFAGDNFSQGTAYLRVGAPAGSDADWRVQGALTQSDIASWILAGSYVSRPSSQRGYNIGFSYSTQRYEGGNPLTMRDVTEGSRNVGELYAFDSVSLVPAVAVTYGGRYARYDYLENQGLFSPRVEVTLNPTRPFRVSALLSRRMQAPGAEEFLPPGDDGIWLPPQRTFSAVEADGTMRAEQTTHVAVQVERDIARSTVSFRAFRQRVDDQLVTIFGAEIADRPVANLGHYMVANAGDAQAVGGTVALRAAFANRVTGSVAYTVSNTRLTPDAGLHYLLLVAPSAVRPVDERIHDLSTSVEANVTETATRVLVFYRVSNGFARPIDAQSASQRGDVDSRFDVQLRQSLPFFNFSNAKWEMLLAIRNSFRDGGPDQSIYDELLVIRPPKRIVGGVTLHF